MKSMNLFGISVALVLAVLAGCADTSSNVMIGESMSADGQESIAKTVVINNKSFANGVELTDINARRDNERLRVQVVLTSQKKDTISFEYAFEWFDASGFALDIPAMHWTPEVIYGMQVLRIQGIAPTTTANSFKFMVREPTDPTPW